MNFQTLPINLQRQLFRKPVQGLFANIAERSYIIRKHHNCFRFHYLSPLSGSDNKDRSRTTPLGTWLCPFPLDVSSVSVNPGTLFFYSNGYPRAESEISSSSFFPITRPWRLNTEIKRGASRPRFRFKRDAVRRAML